MSVHAVAAAERTAPWRLAALRRRIGRRRSLSVGLAMLALMALGCLLVPVVSPYGPNELAGTPLQAPSGAHPLGTDSVGRDILTRTFAGGRVDLLTAAVVVTFSMLVGTLLGTLAGITRSGWVDAVLMRLVDALLAFPAVVLILSLVVLIGPERSLGPAPAGLPATILSFFIIGWTYYARLARGQALALRERDYVTAARTIGYSQWRIVTRHVAPTVFRINAAYAVADAIVVLITVGSLAFLGAGVQPPTAEWGSMMFEGRGFLQSAWWISFVPGTMLVITGVALSLVADALLAPIQVRDDG